MRAINKNDLIYNNNGNIDWMSMVGKKIRFTYDDIESYLIVDKMLDSKKAIISGEYNSNFAIKKLDIRDCKLNRFLKVSTREYKYNIGDVVNGLEIMNKTKVLHGKYMEKGYTVKCIIDGYTYDVYETNLNKNIGCGVCGGKVCVAGINDIATTRPDLVKYLKNKDDANLYTRGSMKKIQVVCPDCNSEKGRLMTVRELSSNGFSCDICGSSGTYPNRLMSNILALLGIEFKKEYQPKWAVDENGIQRRYDFYIPSKSLIIEMDGGWHYFDNNITGQSALKSKEIDDWKDIIAKKNDIDVMRIDCKESTVDYIIQKIKESNFPYVLKDDIVCEAEEKSRMNIVKEVCSVYSNNPDLSNEEIGLLFGISRASVLKMLKIGNNIGICEYNPRDTIERCLGLATNANKREIEVFRDGISVGIFESAKYIEENSMALFGTHIKSRAIPMVCRGERKQHKGFSFKYIDKKQRGDIDE